MQESGGAGVARLLGRIAAALGILGTVLVLASCGDDDGGGSGGVRDVDADRVIFADYGGTTREARTVAYFGPFSEETGVPVVSDDADIAKLPLFAEQGRAEWDLIDTDGWDVIRFKDVIAELPKDVTRGDLLPKSYADYTTGGLLGSNGIGYSAEAGPVPRSWADFFDTEKFPGKRAVLTQPYIILEAALLADGVPCEKLYPIDFDRAFAKLDEIRDDLLFVDTLAQSVQFLAQGSVSMAWTTNSRLQALKDQGLSVDFVWNEALTTWTTPTVPKDAPSRDAAFALMDLMAQPERQAEFARLTGYGPSNSKALDLLDEETLDTLPNSPEHDKVDCEVSDEKLAKQFDEYVKRYTAWLAQG